MGEKAGSVIGGAGWCTSRWHDYLKHGIDRANEIQTSRLTLICIIGHRIASSLWHSLKNVTPHGN
jgi:hypothetical protein